MVVGEGERERVRVKCAGKYFHFRIHSGFVHPLQDVALHQFLPLSFVQWCPAPGNTLFAYNIILPPFARSSSGSVPFPGLLLCALLCPSVNIEASENVYDRQVNGGYCFNLFSDNNDRIEMRFYNLLIALRTVSYTHAQVARAQSCATHVQHIGRFSRVTCVPRGAKRRLSH